MNEIATIAISAITSVVVAYATAKAASYSKDVVGERKEWRDKIRELTVEAARMIQSNETQTERFYTIFSEFRVRLNPDSPHDNQILDTLKRSMSAPDEILREKFLAQAARLLGHDWERAKAESRLISFPRPNEHEIRRLRSSDYLD
jgi:hypothetical protein